MIDDRLMLEICSSTALGILDARGMMDAPELMDRVNHAVGTNHPTSYLWRIMEYPSPGRWFSMDWDNEWQGGVHRFHVVVDLTEEAREMIG